MNIDDLTLGEIKQLQGMLSDKQDGLNSMIGEECIIRTYLAGVWFGILDQKSGEEVILNQARRMWRWWAAKSISLSGVARYGILQDKSKIAPPVDSVWLEAIEIIPCSTQASASIKGAGYAEAE